MISTLTKVVKTDGFLGLYRGLLPPLAGSIFFRSVQFAVYGSAHSAKFDGEDGALTRLWRSEIPLTGGLEIRVIGAGLLASTARASFEAPLEFMKVRRQTGSTWRLHKDWRTSLKNPVGEMRNLFTGFGFVPRLDTYCLRSEMYVGLLG